MNQEEQPEVIETETEVVTQETNNEPKDPVEMSDEEYENWLNSDDEENTSVDSSTDSDSDGDDSDEEDIQESDEKDEKTVDEKEETTVDKKELWKLKVEGTEVEFDPNDEEKTRQFVQKGLAAEYRFREAAQMRSEAQDLLNTLKDDPLSVLTHESLGIDIVKLAEQVICDEMLKEDNPEHYERVVQERNDKKELARYRAEQQRAKEEAERKAEQERAEEERQKIEQQLTKDISTAISKSQLPKEDQSLQQVAQVMFMAAQSGQNISVEEATKRVETQYLNWLQNQPKTEKKVEVPKTITQPKGTKRKKEPKKHVSDNDFINSILKGL